MPVKNFREWYAKNREKITLRRRDLMRFRRAAARRLVDPLKEEPCKDCHNRYNPVCMEFDHRDPTVKRGTISNFVSKGYPVEVILAELEKCDLVCSNCHAIRTWRQRNETRT